MLVLSGSLGSCVALVSLRVLDATFVIVGPIRVDPVVCCSEGASGRLPFYLHVANNEEEWRTHACNDSSCDGKADSERNVSVLAYLKKHADSKHLSKEESQRGKGYRFASRVLLDVVHYKWRCDELSDEES